MDEMEEDEDEVEDEEEEEGDEPEKKKVVAEKNGADKKPAAAAPAPVIISINIPNCLNQILTDIIVRFNQDYVRHTSWLKSVLNPKLQQIMLN